MAEEKKTKPRIGKTALITLASIGGIIAIVLPFFCITLQQELYLVSNRSK